MFFVTITLYISTDVQFLEAVFMSKLRQVLLSRPIVSGIVAGARSAFLNLSDFVQSPSVAFSDSGKLLVIQISSPSPFIVWHDW